MFGLSVFPIQLDWKTQALEALATPFQALAAHWSIWLLVGACIGSFLSMLAYRLPLIREARAKGQAPALSISHPPSACAHCGTPLRWHQNIPFVGFLLHRKSTPCCQRPIPARYLVLETCSTAWAGAVWAIAPSYQGNTFFVWWWSILGWTVILFLSLGIRFIRGMISAKKSVG